jgi:hypothetical protein
LDGLRTESEVEGLGGEVTNDVGSISSPKGEDTLFPVSTRESVTNALVRSGETTLLDLSM